MASLFRRCLLTQILLLGLAHGAASQTGGTVTGTVTDTTKAVLPGVTVSLSGAARMGTAVVVTDEAGLYRIPAVPPGIYKIVFELPGFSRVVRDEIDVRLRFTATLNVELSPASVAETVTVVGASPVVDLQSTRVTMSLDAKELAVLPTGARDTWAVIAQAPGVAMARVDVGGSMALSGAASTAYGIPSGEGNSRGVVEGIVTNVAAGDVGSDNGLFVDFGSVEQASVSAIANSAEMPSGGMLTQVISKSGGNSYHGGVYVDYENSALQAHNIDAAQIARGLAGSSTFPATDLNRINQYHDFNADLGGYLRKDRLWWYGSYRYTLIDASLPNFLDMTSTISAPSYSGKVTYNLTARHKLIGYGTRVKKDEPFNISAIVIPGGRSTSALLSKATTEDNQNPGWVWKGEYNGTIGSNLLIEALAGRFRRSSVKAGRSSAPRVEDTGNNFVAGGTRAVQQIWDRPQVNGSVSYFKNGWLGSHNVKIGGEIMGDTSTDDVRGFADPRSAVSVFNNGVPIEVYVYQSPYKSVRGMWTAGAYANDTWQPGRRMTLNLGIRLDRQVPYLPEQSGPLGEQFARVDPVLVWTQVGPRFGVSYDFSGNGRTVLKVNYAQYFPNQGSAVAGSITPNPAQWFRRYAWTTDLNGNGVWDAGEEGRLIQVSGGSASTVLDSDLQNSYTRQAAAFFERELMASFGVRTGVVWNGQRQIFAQVNANRPLAAYSVPITIRDLGPDGRAGTADDGSTFTAYNLSADALSLPVVNVTRNIPEITNDFYTWEVTATKRQSSRWSLLASFATTWNRVTNFGKQSTFISSYMPSSFINTVNGENRYTTWQGKVVGSVSLPWGVRISPILRHQSGTPFGRTFVAAMNYGNATVLAEPVGARRTDNISVFDVRAEKGFDVAHSIRSIGFFDVYNIFNSNAAFAVATTSGSAFLRPSTITPPRVARVGVRLLW